MSSAAIPTEMLGLPHLSRELVQIVEPGQVVPNRDRIYNLVCGGELTMIQFIRGRWYCPRPELPNLALALGLRLRLKQPGQKESAPPRASRRSAA
jgi:hypothetical protein